MDELLKQLDGMNALAAARLNYDKTLALLQALKSGAVTLDHVTLVADGWQVSAAAPVAIFAPDQERAESEQLKPGA